MWQENGTCKIGIALIIGGTTPSRMASALTAAAAGIRVGGVNSRGKTNNGEAFT